MIKRAKRTTLDATVIDDIWRYWKRVYETSETRTYAANEVARIVGCSSATVLRVVSAFEDVAAGNVIRHDPRKYPSKFMVDYINENFPCKKSSSNVSPISSGNEPTVNVSDIKMLVQSIDKLTEAINKRNELDEIFLSRVCRR